MVFEDEKDLHSEQFFLHKTTAISHVCNISPRSDRAISDFLDFSEIRKVFFLLILIAILTLTSHLHKLSHTKMNIGFHWQGYEITHVDVRFIP